MLSKPPLEVSSYGLYQLIGYFHSEHGKYLLHRLKGRIPFATLNILHSGKTYAGHLRKVELRYFQLRPSFFKCIF